MRFRRHAGNADVVRQEFAAEKGIAPSLRTVEREVTHLRRELTAEARATMRFETPPGRQLQVDFGERRIALGDTSTKMFLFVATLGKTFVSREHQDATRPPPASFSPSRCGSKYVRNAVIPFLPISITLTPP